MAKLKEYLAALKRCATDEEIDALFDKVLTDYHNGRISWEDLQTFVKAVANKRFWGT